MSERRMLPQCNSEEVSVYLRNSQKRALLVKFARYVQYEQIHKIASQKLRIPHDKLILFFKGERLFGRQQIALTQKCIIHIVNLDKVNREPITVQIKRIQGEKLTHKFKLSPNTNIKDFINGEMHEVFNQNSDEVFLVYTGKQLDLTKTFQEEFVEDQSQLLCVRLDESQFQITPSNLSNYSQGRQNSQPSVKKDQSQFKQKANPEIQLKPGRTYVQSFLKKPISPTHNTKDEQQGFIEIKKQKQQNAKGPALKSQVISEQQHLIPFLEADRLKNVIQFQSFNCDLTQNKKIQQQNVNFNIIGFPANNLSHSEQEYGYNKSEYKATSNQLSNYFQQAFKQNGSRLPFQSQSKETEKPDKIKGYLQNKPEFYVQVPAQGQFNKTVEQNMENDHLSPQRINDDQGQQRRIKHFFWENKSSTPINTYGGNQIKPQLPNEVVNLLQSLKYNSNRNQIQDKPINQQSQKLSQLQVQKNQNLLFKPQNEDQSINLQTNPKDIDSPTNTVPQHNQENNLNQANSQISQGSLQQRYQITQQNRENKYQFQAQKQILHPLEIDQNAGKQKSVIPQVLEKISNPSVGNILSAFNKFKGKINPDFQPAEEKSERLNQQKIRCEIIPNDNHHSQSSHKTGHSPVPQNLTVYQEQAPKFNSSDSLPSNDQLPRQKQLLKQFHQKQQQIKIPESQIKSLFTPIETKQSPQILDLISYSLDIKHADFQVEKPNPQNYEGYAEKANEIEDKVGDNLLTEVQQTFFSVPQNKSQLERQNLLSQSNGLEKKYESKVSNLNREQSDFVNNIQSNSYQKNGLATEQKKLVYSQDKKQLQKQQKLPQFVDHQKPLSEEYDQGQQLNQNTSNIEEQKDESFERVDVPLQQAVEFKAGDLIYSGDINANNTENLMKNIMEEYSHLLGKTSHQYQRNSHA